MAGPTDGHQRSCSDSATRRRRTFLPALGAAALLLWLPRMTGGRIGPCLVSGDSLAEAPAGSVIWVWPKGVAAGAMVTAWGRLDDPEASEDRQPQLLVKWYDGHQLYSTSLNQTVSEFELRGRVVGITHFERVCPWLTHKSSLSPAANYRPATPAQQLEGRRQRLCEQIKTATLLKRGGLQWRNLDHRVLEAAQAKTVSLTLPEPCRALGVLFSTSAHGTLRICAGQRVAKEVRGVASEPVTIVAPDRQAIDHLELAIVAGNGPTVTPERVELRAVRKLR